MPEVHDQSARAHLQLADPALAVWMERVGALALPQPESFTLVDALARSILYQQLNGKAAATIVARVEQALGTRRIGARALRDVDEGVLRAAGVSGGKVRALKDLAAHAGARGLPNPRQLVEMSEEEIVEKLTIVRGVGPWTVHMLLIFRLGRHDVLPISDYGVRAGAQLVHGLESLPDARTLSELAHAWRPYRSLASLYLWRALDWSRTKGQADPLRNPG